MFAEDMYDRGHVSDATKRARALYHIDSIVRCNRLTSEQVGMEEVRKSTTVIGSNIEM